MLAWYLRDLAPSLGLSALLCVGVLFSLLLLESCHG